MPDKIVSRRIDGDAFVNHDIWDNLPFAVNQFQKANGSENSIYKTALKLCWNENEVFIKFFCQDTEILSRFTEYNDPVYEQEAVEVFLAPENRNKYFEIDISPKNVVFDSFIRNNLEGNDFDPDPSWSCDGLRTKVMRENTGGDNFGNWEAIFSIPFSSLRSHPGECNVWFANFYRINRVPNEEFSCWCPTMASPPNFHVPKHFGELCFR